MNKEVIAEHMAKPMTAGGLAFLATRFLTYGNLNLNISSCN